MDILVSILILNKNIIILSSFTNGFCWGTSPSDHFIVELRHDSWWGKNNKLNLRGKCVLTTCVSLSFSLPWSVFYFFCPVYNLLPLILSVSSNPNSNSLLHSFSSLLYFHIFISVNCWDVSAPTSALASVPTSVNFLCYYPAIKTHKSLQA